MFLMTDKVTANAGGNQQVQFTPVLHLLQDPLLDLDGLHRLLDHAGLAFYYVGNVICSPRVSVLVRHQTFPLPKEGNGWPSASPL